MTKQQAIRELVKLGWKVINQRKGHSSVELEPPVCAAYPADWKAWGTDARIVVANPQDLLAEILGRN